MTSAPRGPSSPDPNFAIHSGKAPSTAGVSPMRWVRAFTSASWTSGYLRTQHHIGELGCDYTSERLAYLAVKEEKSSGKMFSCVSLDTRSSKAFFFNSDTAHYERQPQMRQTRIQVQCWDVLLTKWANRYIDFGEHRGGSWGCTTFE